MSQSNTVLQNRGAGAVRERAKTPRESVDLFFA
jgi:hypothetical protein